MVPTGGWVEGTHSDSTEMELRKPCHFISQTLCSLLTLLSEFQLC